MLEGTSMRPCKMVYTRYLFVFTAAERLQKKPLIHFSFELLLLGSNRLQGTHLTPVPSTCDYQWLIAMYITWQAVLQQHSYTQYSSRIESKYKLEYKYGFWSDLRAPNFNSGGVSPQTPLAWVCLRMHHCQCIDNTAVLYYLWSVPPQSQVPSDASVLDLIGQLQVV